MTILMQKQFDRFVCFFEGVIHHQSLLGGDVIIIKSLNYESCTVDFFVVIRIVALSPYGGIITICLSFIL